MNKLNNNIAIVLLLLHFGLYSQSNNRAIARQGQVSFFSYTSVENIEASNNQVLSIIDQQNGKVAVRVLLRAFVFKKALMEEHFNESYVESDIYPELIFDGKLIDYDASKFGDSPQFIKGIMDFHGVKKEIEIKANVAVTNRKIVLSGDFEVAIDDFKIKVPALLVPNISKEIQVKFRFEYSPYEK